MPSIAAFSASSFARRSAPQAFGLRLYFTGRGVALGRDSFSFASAVLCLSNCRFARSRRSCVDIMLSQQAPGAAGARNTGSQPQCPGHPAGRNTTLKEVGERSRYRRSRMLQRPSTFIGAFAFEALIL